MIQIKRLLLLSLVSALLLSCITEQQFTYTGADSAPTPDGKTADGASDTGIPETQVELPEPVDTAGELLHDVQADSPALDVPRDELGEPTLDVPIDLQADLPPDLQADLLADLDIIEDLPADNVDAVDDAADLPPDVPCIPQCEAKQCGDDGCNGSCGECFQDEVCNNGQCCIPDCWDKECGDDGCGGTCGQCDEQDLCLAFACCSPQCDVDDSNQCTQPTCNPETGDCLQTDHYLNGMPCDDGNPCTGNDMCAAGECWDDVLVLPNGTVTDCTCLTDDDCVPLDDDDNLCNGYPRCDNMDTPDEQGHCFIEPQWAPVCDDNEQCTQDSCDPLTGCIYDSVEKNGQPCDDDNPCTTGENCTAGECMGSSPTICNDNSPCTDDSCSSQAGGCQFVPNTAPCEDGNPCTENDSCSGGDCQPGTPKVCEPDVPCVLVHCDPAQAGCVYLPDDSKCVDDNPCTKDTCTAGSGCSNEPEDFLPCDDGEPCTVGDYCMNMLCTAGQQVPGCSDPDHDGLENDEDSCPFAYDPQQLDLDDDGVKDACVPAAAVATLPSGLTVALSAGGQDSGFRRTNEPVELPLRNGIIDESLLLYFDFDSGEVVDNSLYGLDNFTKLGDGYSLVEPPSGDLGSAWSMDGPSCILLTDKPSYPASEFTMMAWFKSGNQAVVFDDFNYLKKSGFLVKIEHDSGEPDGTGRYFVSIGNGTTMENIYSPSDPWDEDEWRHLAFTFANGHWTAFVNGRQVMQGTSSAQFAADDGDPAAIGCNDQVDGEFPQQYPLTIDEFLFFDRPLHAREVAAYYQSRLPYATNIVQGAQVDFDDVRVVEAPGLMDPGLSDPFVKRSRIVGTAPHSNTPCPGPDSMAEAPESRDDLCGVELYTRFDGNLTDETGAFLLQQAGGQVPYTYGRFGDEAGALQFSANSGYLTVAPEGGEPGQGQGAALTMEVWLNWTGTKTNEKMCLVCQENVDDTIDIFFGVGVSLYPTCSLRTGEQGLVTISGPTRVQPARWMHLGCVFDGSHLMLYVDGLLVSRKPLGNKLVESTGAIYMGAQDADGNGRFMGAVDDFVAHWVAKSADYMYHRARPALPMVRFLANSQMTPDLTGAYPARMYALRWGDPQVHRQLPFVSDPGSGVCYGLLNNCLGYGGWWRFADRPGDLAIDSSTAKNNGTVIAGAGGILAEGTESGAALQFAEDAVRYVEVKEATFLAATNELSVEARVRPYSETPLVQYLAHKLDSAGSQYGLSLDYSNAQGPQSAQMIVEVEGGGTTCPELAPPAEINGFDWHTLAFTWLAGAPGTVTGYVNHNSDSTAACGASLSPSFDVFYIGDEDGPGDGQTDKPHNFVGMLDSVRVMLRALPADELLHFPLYRWELK